MSAKEKKTPSLKEQLQMYEQYKQQGNTFDAFNRALKEKELNQKRMQVRAERATRIVGNYQMNKQYPAQWAPGGKADRLLTAADRLKQQQEEAQNPQAVKPADFRDWSMVDNLLNPKSKVNAQIAKRPAEEQEYWNGVRAELQEQLTPQQKKADALRRPLLTYLIR